MEYILVTGSKGQLGSEIYELSTNYKELKFIFTDIDNLDISNKKQIIQFFEDNKINFIVNCAAYTAVDKAESEEELTNKINIIGVKNLAEISLKKKIPIIHISTDYVYDGESFSPYKEDNPTLPQSIYGKSKLAGEQELQKNPDNIIIRTSWLYSSYGNNFVKTIIRLGKERDNLGVVFDQIGTPTYAKDLAETILNIIQLSNKNEKNFVNGIYNYSNEGVCSWYDFAIEIFKITKINCKVSPIETIDFPTPAKRPNFSVLNKSKIKNTFNISIPHWSESLKNCLVKKK